jgi:hypothetical protein
MTRFSYRAAGGGAALLLAALLPGCGNNVDDQPIVAGGNSLCFSVYQQCINPIFNATLQGRTGAVTCSAGGCHSAETGSGGSFKIVPGAAQNSSDMMSNFFSAESLTDLDDPIESLLLEKPTATLNTQIGHAGGDIFPNTSDVCFVEIQNWISTRVNSPTDAACASTCVPVDTSTCGY